VGAVLFACQEGEDCGEGEGEGAHPYKVAGALGRGGEEWERERFETYKSMGWCSASSTYEEWKEERARRKETEDDAYRRTFGTGFYWRKKQEREKEQDKRERKRKREEAAGEGGATGSAGDEQDTETQEYEWVENGAAEQEADRKQVRGIKELEKL